MMTAHHATLLLRLQGPMQAWGVQSRFDIRDTGREPSKSGVVGLLCAALGRPREAPVEDLAALQMGVRVDQEGRLLRDYHTVLDVYKASGKRPSREKQSGFTTVSRRYFLADAAFLVGLEGDSELLAELHAALRRPVWPLFLGRKAFVPGLPVWLADGLKSLPLRTALEQYEWLGKRRELYRTIEQEGRVRAVFEDETGDHVRSDQPLSFAERRFAPRRVSITSIPTPPLPAALREQDEKENS